MSVRLKNGRWIAEIYDPAKGRKAHVKAAEHGVPQPTNERQARRLERLALNARDERKPGGGEETLGGFSKRWPAQYPGRGRGESTLVFYREQVAGFVEQHRDRRLRSITREEARAAIVARPGTLGPLRTMFSDAASDRLVDANPFAELGLKRSKGREDITVLTLTELEQVKALILDEYDEAGLDMAAMVEWAAFTCMRPGEIFAARYSLLDGDVYHLARQWNSRLGKETVPKHDGVGTIYVPEPAIAAINAKPRRLGDDLIFRSRRGRQWTNHSLGYAWRPIRDKFTTKLPKGHHLRQRLALDPRDRLDFYELRHLGASYMLNVLKLEPWVIAEQLRHHDGGQLVTGLYGHPSREEAIRRMREAHTASSPVSGEHRGSRIREAQV